MAEEKLIVYGANCTWWDTIDKAGKFQGAHSLPCCPHCRSVLFQTTETKWIDGAHKYEEGGHPNYVAKLNWSRGKCFKSWADAEKSYAKRPS